MMPITSVVNLDNYRALNETGTFTVTFIGFNFATPEGRQERSAIFKPPGYIFVNNIPLR
jgi:hypothetical protein